ncbi:MAG: hypothetical protein ACXV8I_11960 [Methylobacter sp.]
MDGLVGGEIGLKTPIFFGHFQIVALAKMLWAGLQFYLGAGVVFVSMLWPVWYFEFNENN